MPLPAAEMVLIRLTHAADLPTPGDLVRQIQNGGGAADADRPHPAAGAVERTSTTATVATPPPTMRADTDDRPRAFAAGGATALPQAETVEAAPDLDSFAAVVAVLGERREAILQAHLKNNVHLVRFEPGRIEIRPDEHAPRTLANRLGALLSEWAGRRWVVAISGEPGEPTLAQQEAADKQRARAEVTAHPLVQAVMATFPGATIEAIRDLAAAIDTPIEGEPDA
jgi:DNA polymerase-3 subunit gamma/tau